MTTPNSEPPTQHPARHSGAHAPSSGLSAAFDDQQFNVASALGGPRGIIESLAPTALYMTVFVATRDAKTAAIGALALVAVLIAARLVQRQSVAPAVGGALVVGIGALTALRTGNGSDFYILGILTNAAWALGLSVALALGYPFVGYIAAAIDQRVAMWKQVPPARALYVRATALYIGLFVAKVAVQAPLFFLDLTDALGVAKLVMGLPLFTAITYVIYLIHRKARAACEAAA